MYKTRIPFGFGSVRPTSEVRRDVEPPRPLPNHMPPLEFQRREGESNDKAARRLLDIWEGAYGD